jgi:hypothetical protein
MPSSGDKEDEETADTKKRRTTGMARVRMRGVIAPADSPTSPATWGSACLTHHKGLIW